MDYDQNIWLFPVARKEAKVHFEKSVRNGVKFKDITKYLDENLIRILGQKERLYIWGLIPTEKSKNIHRRMKSGDIVIFYLGTKEKYNYITKIILTFENEKLAEYLWKRNDKGKTWSLIIILDKPIVMDKIRSQELEQLLRTKDICGYVKPPQGIMRIRRKSCANSIISWFLGKVQKKSFISKKISNIFDIINRELKRKGQIILYGPVGTGKTWLALQFVKKRVDGSNYEFITFHQSYSYEEFIEGIKPEISGGNITYEKSDGIFKRLAIKAIWEALKNKEKLNKKVFYTKMKKLSFNKALENFKQNYKEGSILRTIFNKKEFIIERYTNKSIVVRPLAGEKYTYYIKIDDLKKLYNNSNKIKKVTDVAKTLGGDTGRDSYYYAIFKMMLELNNGLADQNEETEYNEIKEKVLQELEERTLTKDDFASVKPFYLIIDEINRGNISKIFGELITLLETDKRLGAENEMIVRLPYSGEKFAVPPNLYIIGTMNTADRSITLLDTALRRRFAFLEIEPDPEMLKDKVINVNLRDLLVKLNENIEKYLDRDHRIGHSFFLKVKSVEDLESVWYQEIMPLLMDYFYNRLEDLSQIIKPFIEKGKENNTFRIKKLKNGDFIKALNQIISGS